MIDVGFKNFIRGNRITFILKPGSTKVKWLIKEALASRKIINCTQGKKVGSILILSTSHLVLSPLKYTSIIKRIKSDPNIINKINDSSLNKDLLEIISKD